MLKIMLIKMRVFSIGLIVISFLVISSVHAQEAHNLKSMAFQMAVEISEARKNSKVAIRPFIRGQSSLSPIAADRLYSYLYKAFSKMTRMGGFQLVDQANIMKLLASREAYYMGNPEDLILQAQADVEILCQPHPLTDTVRLSCVATDLHTAITYATGEAVLDFDSQRASAIDHESAVRILSESFVAEMTDMQHIYAAFILDMQTGRQTETTDMLGRNLLTAIQRDVLQTQEDLQHHYEANRVLNDSLKPPPLANKSYSLRGDLRHIDEEVLELHVILEKENQPINADTIRILKSSLPKELQKTAGSQIVNPRFTAAGVAVISRHLDRDAAEQAALNLARARIIAQALGLAAPAVQKISQEADASRVLLQYLGQAIPVQERLLRRDINAVTNEVHVSLEAGFRVLGHRIRPQFSAKLNKSSYQAGENILLSLKSQGDLNLGIYGWFADGQLVRIYPHKGFKSLTLKRTTPVTLPKPHEAPLASAPMPYPGNVQDTEALLVLASTERFDFDTLAPTLGETVSDSQAKAISATSFFNDLGQRELSTLGITILPYQIRN